MVFPNSQAPSTTTTTLPNSQAPFTTTTTSLCTDGDRNKRSTHLPPLLLLPLRGLSPVVGLQLRQILKLAQEILHLKVDHVPETLERGEDKEQSHSLPSKERRPGLEAVMAS